MPKPAKENLTPWIRLKKVSFSYRFAGKCNRVKEIFMTSRIDSLRVKAKLLQKAKKKSAKKAVKKTAKKSAKKAVKKTAKKTAKKPAKK